MENKEPQGYLFNTIAFYNSEQLETILENVTEEQSFFYVTVALQQAYRAGLYTMEETEIISKSIRNLKNTFTPENGRESQN